MFEQSHFSDLHFFQNLCTLEFSLSNMRSPDDSPLGLSIATADSAGLLLFRWGCGLWIELRPRATIELKVGDRLISVAISHHRIISPNKCRPARKSDRERHLLGFSSRMFFSNTEVYTSKFVNAGVVWWVYILTCGQIGSSKYRRLRTNGFGNVRASPTCLSDGLSSWRKIRYLLIILH